MITIPILIASMGGLACGDSEPDANTVATGAGHRWTVTQATSLLAPSEQLPAEPDVVRALANVWIDYTLLATAAAEDSTMQQIDVSALVRPLVEERLLIVFRDSAIKVDTIPTSELQSQYAREAVGSVARIRDILLAWPRESTPAQKDSVRRAMAELRRRIVDQREDFSRVARAHSQDPASGPRGGEVGLIGRGQLSAELDEAVFSLNPGEVSQPVETGQGIHLIQVLERQKPSFSDFRNIELSRAFARAESAFVARLATDAKPELAEDAPKVVRQLASDPRVALSRFDEIRPVIRYANGEVTQGEILRYLQALPPDARNQIAQSVDDAVPTRIVRSIMHRELIIADAERRGMSINPEVVDELRRAARRNLLEAAHQMGLVLPKDETEGRRQQIADAVTQLMTGMLDGSRREVTPLGTMSYVLREKYPAGVNDSAIAQVVARVKQQRSTTASDSLTGR